MSETIRIKQHKDFTEVKERYGTWQIRPKMRHPDIKLLKLFKAINIPYNTIITLRSS